MTCGMTSGVQKKYLATQSGVLRAGLVEGKSVGDILLDTGCSRTQRLVPEGELKKGNAVAIRCAHGDTVLYPLADIMVEGNVRQISVEAEVSQTLPMSVLLAVDNSELVEMLQVDRVEEALAVTTRDQARKQKEETEMLMDASGVRPNAVRDELPVWMCQLNDGESNGKKWRTKEGEAGRETEEKPAAGRSGD